VLRDIFKLWHIKEDKKEENLIFKIISSTKTRPISS